MAKLIIINSQNDQIDQVLCENFILSFPNKLLNKLLKKIYLISQ